MKVSKLSISAKKASVSDFLSGFLSSNSAEITEVTKYTLIFLLIFIYLLGMAYNALRVYEARKGSGERQRTAYLLLYAVAISISIIGISGEAGLGMSFIVLGSTIKSNSSKSTCPIRGCEPFSSTKTSRLADRPLSSMFTTP